MIGRLPHPKDAQRCVFVALLYDHVEGVWKPAQDPFHETEEQARDACADELTQRAAAMTINLDRLAARPEERDGIRVDGIDYKLDTATGLLKALATGSQASAEKAFVETVIAATREPPKTPVQPQLSAEEAFADAVIASIKQVQTDRATDPAVIAGGLRLVIARLSAQLDAMESGAS